MSGTWGTIDGDHFTKSQPAPMKCLIQHNIEMEQKRKETFHDKVRQINMHFCHKMSPFIMSNRHRMVLEADAEDIDALQRFILQVHKAEIEIQKVHTSFDSKNLNFTMQIQMESAEDVQSLVILKMRTYSESFTLAHELRMKRSLY
jgi:hypothetical protein